MAAAEEARSEEEEGESSSEAGDRRPERQRRGMQEQGGGGEWWEEGGGTERWWEWQADGGGWWRQRSRFRRPGERPRDAEEDARSAAAAAEWRRLKRRGCDDKTWKARRQEKLLGPMLRAVGAHVDEAEPRPAATVHAEVEQAPAPFVFSGGRASCHTPLPFAFSVGPAAAAFTFGVRSPLPETVSPSVGAWQEGVGPQPAAKVHTQASEAEQLLEVGTTAEERAWWEEDEVWRMRRRLARLGYGVGAHWAGATGACSGGSGEGACVVDRGQATERLGQAMAEGADGAALEEAARCVRHTLADSLRRASAVDSAATLRWLKRQIAAVEAAAGAGARTDPETAAFVAKCIALYDRAQARGAGGAGRDSMAVGSGRRGGGRQRRHARAARLCADGSDGGGGVGGEAGGEGGGGGG